MVSLSLLCSATITLTNHRFKAVLAIDGKTGLTWQLYWIHDIDTHLDHALHHHVVFLKL
jgi:hypothetical protein